MMWWVLGFYLVAWLTVYIYAFRHQHDPFWQGFLDPFNLRRTWTIRHED